MPLQHSRRHFLAIGAGTAILIACGGGGDGAPSAPDPQDVEANSPVRVTLSTQVGDSSVRLEARVSPNTAATRVTFDVDGGTIRVMTDAAITAGVFATNIPRDRLGRGRHTIVATAQGDGPPTFQSDVATMDLGTNAPMKVLIQAIAGASPPAFQIDIDGPEGTYGVNIFLDGAFLGGRRSSTRQLRITPSVMAGPHKLTVDVTNEAGDSAVSSIEFTA